MKAERLVVVSNRLPDLEHDSKEDVRRQAPVGGLIAALRPVLSEAGGAVWFGWNGRYTPGSKAGGIAEKPLGDILLAGLEIPETEFNAFYNGYCNRSLWPICHSMLDRMHQLRSWERAYRSVNNRFATAILPKLHDGDLVWIHDFHLIPLGGILRKSGWKGSLGFFLHVPFPPFEIWSVLSDPALLLRDLMAYDLVGFHTQAYLENYVRSCSRALHAVWDGRKLSADGCDQWVGFYPIGIDVDRILPAVKSGTGKGRRVRRLGTLADQKLLLSVDRLDYTKGIPERMSAMAVLFRNWPKWKRRVLLIQICSPSRTRVPEYVDQKQLVEAAVGHVNGEWGDPDWVPVHYLFRTFHYSELVQFYREADIGLVTPIRDGMNLVAKEYVAAQDPEDPGVLVLSRFAGVAEEMPEAVLVNPYLAEDVADGITRALQMSNKKRRQIHSALLSGVLERPARRWAQEFLDTLRAAR